MTLNLSVESWLVDLFDHFNNDPDPVREGFETDFMTDVGERFSEEKTELFVSGKMFEILKRIGEERYGMEWSEYEN